jgi:hypothetical protein
MKASEALRKMRSLARSLAGELREGSHFGGIMFKTAAGKPFASWDDRGDDGEIVVQLEPDHVEALIEKDARLERYSRAKNCVLIRVSVFDWSEIHPLVEESFHRVVSATDAKRKKAKKTSTKTAVKSSEISKKRSNEKKDKEAVSRGARPRRRT